MDLSFTLQPSRRTAHWGATLADIKAVADQRRLDNDRRRAGKLPLMADGQRDWVLVLACRLVPDMAGTVDTEVLGGSFNAHVARQLMVGKESEDGIYLRALADVQGSVA